MRLVWGVLSLLVVLATVLFIGKKQLETTRVQAPSAASAPNVGTPAQQSQTLQKKVQDDVNRLMQQAPARGEPEQ